MRLRLVSAATARHEVPMTLDLFADQSTAPRCGDVEDWAESVGFVRLIGLDEAGRGPLAGPVVCGAAILPRPCPIDGLDDSKRLSPSRRESLFERITDTAIAWAVVTISPTEIDASNILAASLEGMKRAWAEII